MQNLELNTKEQPLLHLAEPPLFNPEICAKVVCDRIFKPLNNRFEMIQNQLERVKYKISPYDKFGSPLFHSFEFLAKLD